MKKILLIILAIVGLLGSISCESNAATSVEINVRGVGDFKIVILTLTADGSGGAVSGQNIDLSFLTSASSSSGSSAWYFYYIETIPGSGAAAPDTYAITFADYDGGTVCKLSARSTTDKEYADAAEDLPNYWPVTGNLTLSVDDIGASNSTVIKLVFVR